MSIYWSKLWFLKGGWVTERKYQGTGSSTNDFWRQKIRVAGLTWRCLRDPTFRSFDTICTSVWQKDTQTDTRWWLIPAHR